MAQLSNLVVNGVSRLLSKLYVSDSVTAPSFIGKLTGNADTATKLTSSAGSATQPVYFANGVPVATTYTLGKSVPSNAVFTDTNTWRGVQNNLTSTVTDQSLSAAQGKVLKDMIDGKAPANHTHNQYYDSGISRTKGTVLAAPASADGRATFRVLTKSDVGLGSVDNTADSAKSVKYAASAGSANTATSVVDYGSTSKTIQIGYGGSGITGDNIKFIAGYTSGDGATVNAKIKDVSKDALRSWLGLGSAAYTGTSAYAAASHTHTKSQITDFPALGTAAAKNVRTLTTAGASGWNDVATDQQYVPDMAFMAYWNGAYSGTSSNLAYCNKGAFGTIVTKNIGDYAVAGHTHTWDSVTGKPSTFTPSSHTHGVIKSLSVNGTTITCTKDDGTTSTIKTQDTNTTYGTFKGATTSAAGGTGLVIAPSAGNANRYLRSDGTWAVPPDTNTTYGVFAKATADAAGSTGLVPAPAKGQQTYYLRGDGTWAVPANTWRGIQDNLTSTSTTDSLSANQGKVLKGLIDGKAASGHTHNYAGSSSAGGAATSANKVNNALTINLNGTSQGAWDGSSAKSISITAASVGATSVTISRW